MRIKKTIMSDYWEFPLDIGAIKLCSTSESDIVLPYTGNLPQQMSTVKKAHICFNVQLVQGASVVLDADLSNGRNVRRSLEATKDELISLLGRFFAQDQEDTGLDSYWLGLWQAHYIEWRRVAMDPKRLLPVISGLPSADKLFINRRLLKECGNCL